MLHQNALSTTKWALPHGLITTTLCTGWCTLWTKCDLDIAHLVICKASIEEAGLVRGKLLQKSSTSHIFFADLI